MDLKAAFDFPPPIAYFANLQANIDYFSELQGTFSILWWIGFRKVRSLFGIALLCSWNSFSFL
jgi:hypothetical protein